MDDDSDAMAAAPPRPRLASHVLPRRHVVDGEERVVLHDQRSDDVVQVGAREWAVLEAADGTREPEGIVVAARRQGAHARVAAVRELLRTLAARGMVEAGEDAELESPSRDEPIACPSMPLGPESVSPTSSVPDDPGARPVVGYPEGLRCDGSGTCCRLYGTVMATPQEAQRIQTLLPHWRVGRVPAERWTTPMRGSAPGPLLALVARDGACGMLREDGRCEVHRVGGAEAKPLGCRLFPRTFVDDGHEVRVSLKPECPCVLDPQAEDTELVAASAWARARDLPPEVVVQPLPDAIELSHGRWAPRAEVRSWMVALAERPAPDDLAATSWALAQLVETEGLDASMLEAAWIAAPPPSTLVMPWIEALHRRASRRAREHAAWRSEGDLVRRTITALATVTLLLRDAEALEEAMAMPPDRPAQEARYWRTALHGHRWLGHAALAVVLRDEAVRLWVARSLPVVMPGVQTEPELRAPLALVEAILRAHGIGAYVDDLRGG
ncbi:MAG: YkgJ family cysteine cluster protein [Nannocystaceae bacterium]